MSILADVASGVVKPVSEFFTRRAEIKAQERQMDSQERVKMHEMRMAQMDRQIQLQAQGLTADANWEMEFARQAASSWKDEYTLMVVSIPMWLCFIPDDLSEWKGGAYYVTEGFKALNATPAWYQLMLLTMFFATVGIRYWRRTQSDT